MEENIFPATRNRHRKEHWNKVSWAAVISCNICWQCFLLIRLILWYPEMIAERLLGEDLGFGTSWLKVTLSLWSNVSSPKSVRQSVSESAIPNVLKEQRLTLHCPDEYFSSVKTWFVCVLTWSVTSCFTVEHSLSTSPLPQSTLTAFSFCTCQY